MAFPFTIKYSGLLNEHFSTDDTQDVMLSVEAYIQKKNGEDITIQDNQLTFTTSFFSGTSWSILSTIEKGIFRIETSNGRSNLNYEFSMYRLLIIAILMSSVFGILSKDFLTGLGCFAAVGGINWLIAIARHRGMIDEIVDSSNTVIKAKHRIS
jgi:hypothetical protein